MIKVLFFARLREQLGCEAVTLDHVGISTVADLRSQLIQLHPQWKDILNEKKLLVAVNQTLAKGDIRLNADDEVAFFPPVTGG